MIILQVLCPTCLLWSRTWMKESLWYVMPQLWWDQLFQFWLISFVSLSCSMAVVFLFYFVLFPPPHPPTQIWLLSLHKEFKENMCLSKIDCVCTYMFLYTEGLNLNIENFNCTVLTWKHKSCHISENEPGESANWSAHIQLNLTPWNDANSNGAERLTVSEEVVSRSEVSQLKRLSQ